MIKHKQRNNQALPTTTKKASSQQPTELTFLEHVHELRKRFFWVVLVLVVASAAGLQFKDQLIVAVMAPLHGQKLIYLTPGGGFSFIFTLCIYFGALFTIPVVVYQLYRFLQPLLGKSSRRFMVIFMFISVLLAVVGALFGYFVTIPAALNFLSTFAGDTVIPSLTADSYLNFVVTYILGLAALFQLPLLLFIFDHVKPIPPGVISSTQNYVILGATVLAAVITPTPDAFNMAIVAIPIVTVYEIGAFAVFVRRRLNGKSRSGRIASATTVKTVSSTTSDAEPLTAIFEELSRQEKPVIEQDDVAQQQAQQQQQLQQQQLQRQHQLQQQKLQQRQLQQQTQRQPQPQSQPIPIPQQQPIKAKPVDGFMVRSPRQSTMQLPVPARQAAPIYAAPPRMAPSRPVRSMDGFMQPSRIRPLTGV